MSRYPDSRLSSLSRNTRINKLTDPARFQFARKRENIPIIFLDFPSFARAASAAGIALFSLHPVK